MHFKLKIASIFLFTLFFSFLFSKNAFAANYSLTGSVKDNSGTAIVGATVDVYSSGTTNDVVPPITTDQSGNYSFPSVPQGTYDIKVTPPSGSNFSPAIALNQSITADDTLNFILAQAGTITVTGHLNNSLGQPVQGQSIEIYTPNSNNLITSAQTDQNGVYTLTFSSGNYWLRVRGGGSSFNLPDNYDMEASYTFSQSMQGFDLTVPAHKVTVHVQDSNGQGIQGITVTEPNQDSAQSLTFGNGVSSFYGVSTDPSGATTNSSGDAILWLFPNSSAYSLIATPPNGSTYSATTLSNVFITSDTTETITLQQPITIKGHLFNNLGQAVQGQSIAIYLPRSNNLVTSTQTDASGAYSLTFSAGTYLLRVQGGGSSFNLPDSYDIDSNYTFTQSVQDFDLTVPANKVTVHVQNAAGQGIQGITVSEPNQKFAQSLSLGNGVTSYYGVSTDPSGAITDQSGNATLWLFPNSSAYSLIATPPSDSAYFATTLSNVFITGDSTETITMQQPITITGHVNNALGQPVQGQSVDIYLPNSNNLVTSSQTDTNGVYTLTFSAGSYLLRVHGGDTSSNLPQNYDIDSNYTFTQSVQDFDLTIPANKVTVHVQDSFGQPIQGVTVTQPNQQFAQNLSLGNGVSSYYGISNYPSGVTTDQSGNATLWLFQNDSRYPYSIIATPQSGSIYTPFTLSNIFVTGDQTELISLQYNHSSPTTTVDLATQFSDGTYSNPTTVTLSATAVTGYSVANTYYTIDDGSQQTYSSPFTVTGSGNHTIKYWSIDNSGVQEAPNSKTFTIAAFTLSGKVYNDDNQNGIQDTGENKYQGATVTLSSGSTVIGTTTTDVNGNYSFANLQPGTYTDTLTVPSGYTATTTNPASIAVSTNTTQNFGIYSKPYVGTVTVNPNPVQINNAVTAITTFTDADTSDTHTAQVNWDVLGSIIPTQNCQVTEPNGSTPGSVSCTLSNGYSSANIYSVAITVSDNDGASDTATNSFVSVYAPTPSGKFAAGQAYVSPTGTYAQNPAINTGIVQLALSYKYSGTMPSEQKQFVMTFSNNTTFSASSIISLVISNGIGSLTGAGTFSNSSTVYNFLVTGEDSTNTVRIKITDPNNNNAVIYDTQPNDQNTAAPTTPVTGPNGQAGHGDVVAG